jgi:hypothetical protein
MMTLLYVGGASTEPLPCQPVINSLEANIVTIADNAHVYVSVIWTADNANEFIIKCNGEVATYSGTEADFLLTFGQNYTFTLIAICGNSQATATLNYFADPCAGQTTPTIASFFINQSTATGAVTFDWETVDSYSQEISNNGAVVVTSNNATGTATIAQPQNLGLQSFTLKAMGVSSLCFVESSQNIELVDQTFYPIAQDSPSYSYYHIIYWDYFKGVTVAPLHLTSNGDFVDVVILDDVGQMIDLTDINIAPLANYTNPFTLYFSPLNYVPSIVSSEEVGKKNNYLALKIFFTHGTTGQAVIGSSILAARGDIFMTLNEDAGLSPINPTRAATISSATGLIPANGQHGDYGSQQILPLFTPNSNGDIWLSFQIKTHATYHTPNHATVGIFTYNPTNSLGYGTRVGNSINLTGLKYRQFSNNTITVIGGYVNKANLLSLAPSGVPYYVTVDSVSWY